MSDTNFPILLVVSGEQRAKTLSAQAAGSGVSIISFESSAFFPSRLSAAWINLPDQRTVSGHRIDQLKAWIKEFIEPRVDDPAKDIVYL